MLRYHGHSGVKPVLWFSDVNFIFLLMSLMLYTMYFALIFTKTIDVS